MCVERCVVDDMCARVCVCVGLCMYRTMCGGRRVGCLMSDVYFYVCVWCVTDYLCDGRRVVDDMCVCADDVCQMTCG